MMRLLFLIIKLCRMMFRDIQSSLHTLSLSFIDIICLYFFHYFYSDVVFIICDNSIILLIQNFKN